MEKMYNIKQINFFLIPLLCCVLSTSASAQSIVVKGRVTDMDTEEGLPFANVYFEDGEGVTTDLEGYYEIFINASNIGDSLVASSLGYGEWKVKVPNTGRDSITINFKLTSSSLQLTELVIVPGENPAHPILRNIIKNKPQNNIEQQGSYQCRRYSKIELDLHNFDEAAFDRKVLEPFKFILDNMDSTSDEKVFLPAYINENVDDLFYIKRKPLREVPRAAKVSGIDASTVVRQVKRLHQPFNIYDNWMPILEKNFASPLSNTGLVNYKYYLVDSTVIQGKWCYKIQFKPKRRQENTFYGDFWVADTSFAIVQINLRKSPDVNINLVDRIIIYEEYELTSAGWLPRKQKMVVDFLPTEKLPGLIARKTQIYEGFIVNDPRTAAAYKEDDPEDFVLEELEQSDDYWKENRMEELSETEITIYKMVDSIKNSPIYKKYSDAIYAITTGWVKGGGIFEFGSLYNAYGGNQVEGSRFQMGIATNLSFSTTYRAEFYGAYGVRDNRWKFGGNFQYNLKKQPRREFVKVSYFDDVIYSNKNSEDAISGSSLAALFRRDIPQRLLHSREAKILYQKELKRGWSGRATFLNRFIDPYGRILSDGTGFNFQYRSPRTNEIDTTVTSTEFIFKIRHAYKEQFWAGHFDRVSLGSKYPIYSFQYTAGIKDVLGSDYSYHKLELEYSHWFYVNPIGFLSYKFRAGRVLGTLPTLLLEAHNGNETFFYSSSGFNVMNRYEFISDTYISWSAVHHFDGFIMNKIPLMRRLKWRALAQFKGVWGTLSDANRNANSLNSSDVAGNIPVRTPAPVPYMEAGVGIENIFKFLQIHAIWRLNYLDNPEAYHFMVQTGVYFSF